MKIVLAKIALGVSLVFIVSFFPPSLLADNESRFSAVVGISPTTMGTVGENISIDFQPFSFIRIGVHGNHEKIFQQDIEYDKLGGPLRGNISKDILKGSVIAGSSLSVRPFKIMPFASATYTRTEMSSLARIIEKADPGQVPFPQDTFAFVDIDETESIISVNFGSDVSLNLGTLSIFLSGSYSPLVSADLTGGYFQNFGTFPDPVTTTYPAFADYGWRENSFSLTGSGQKYDAGASFSLSSRRPFPLKISGFSHLRRFIYDGNTMVSNSVFFAYKSSPEADMEIQSGSNNLLATVDVVDTSLEAGISLALLFFRDLLGLSGYPRLGISYVRAMRDMEFFYYDPSPEKREKWIEDYTYARFSLSWNL